MFLPVLLLVCDAEEAESWLYICREDGCSVVTWFYRNCLKEKQLSHLVVFFSSGIWTYHCKVIPNSKCSYLCCCSGMLRRQREQKAVYGYVPKSLNCIPDSSTCLPSSRLSPSHRGRTGETRGNHRRTADSFDRLLWSLFFIWWWYPFKVIVYS